MTPLIRYSHTLPLMLAAIIAGCGGGGGGGAAPSTSDPNAPVTIQSYFVTGTSATVNGVAPINPGVNGGQFSATWTVTGNSIYTVRIAVSTDTTHDGNDVEIVTGGCGKASVLDNCHASGTVTCTFNNSNVMACADQVDTFPSRDLSTFLSGGIPMNAYLVIKACNPMLTSCPTTAAAIQIQ